MEYKSVSIEINPDDCELEQGIVTGYASVFGNCDSTGDIMDSGAFTKTLQENAPRIKMLYMHDMSLVLGLPELSCDDYGLKFTAQIIPTSYGTDALALLRAGAISECSIGFETIKSKMIPSPSPNFTKARLLQEVKLWDISAVVMLLTPWHALHPLNQLGIFRQN